MNQNGFEPRNMPGYSYGQPNNYPQTGHPGTGGTQPPAGNYGNQGAGPYSYFSAQASGGYNPTPVQTAGNSYNTIPPVSGNNGYSPTPPVQVNNGYQFGNPISAGAGYSPTPPMPSGNGYGNYVPQPTPVSPTGSFIPQTPYSPGYTSPGYQAGYSKPAANGYPQGYSPYSQMGKVPQNTIPPKQTPQQVPLNGGGYVPQKVNIRKRPIEKSDIVLYAVGGALILLFILAFWPLSNIVWLKWLFLIPAVFSTALLWLRPITDDGKRLCYTIVAGALCIAMIISIVQTQPVSDKTNSAKPQSGNQTTSAGSGTGTGSSVSGTSDPYAGYGSSNYQPNTTSAPQQTSNANAIAGNRLLQFFTYWGENKIDNMVELCAPSWQVKQESAKKSLFTMLQNRRPTEFMLENISGPQGGDSLTFIMRVSIDKNNGKPVSIYQMSVRMVNESGNWYVDPNSLVSNEIQETPDPNATPVVTPTPSPYVDGNTVLYYNPDGGKQYHLDPNCIAIHSKYLPLKGKFTYSEINEGKYAELEPCNVCGAPLRNR